MLGGRGGVGEKHLLPGRAGSRLCEAVLAEAIVVFVGAIYVVFA